MCDAPVPCACTIEGREKRRAAHIARHDAFANLAYRLSTAGVASEDEIALLYAQSEAEWDDAIHIAAADDPLRSLCGLYGRNLTDLPNRPDSWAGCWECLTRADRLAKSADERVLVPALT